MDQRPETLTRLAASRLPLALVALAVVLAAILRVDGVTSRFGYVREPAWLQALQAGSRRLVGILHPPAPDWEPEPEHLHRDGPPTHYVSDPYTYLQHAREMTSFYEGHFREPVFPFVVKSYLWLLNDQDVSVSFTSVTFSVLCVLMTYLMGAMAFSRWVGVVAALGLAIESDAIFWSTSGWRDDAFAFAVAVSVCAVLYHRRRPSTASAIALGVSAALACLTRIFAVSFLGPVWVYLLLSSGGDWRRRARHLAIATIAAAALLSPYLVNCWRIYGDPLYALNYQPLAYLEWEHVAPATPPGAAGYIGQKLRSEPFRTLDTAALGMTSYPFLNKWSGFDPWQQGLGRCLAGAALLGLILFAASANGRLLLLVMVSALVPFAFTWRLSDDWRYTEFAYPFFLVASGLVVVTTGIRLLRPVRWKGRVPRRMSLSTACGWTAFLGSIGLIAWTILRVLPVLTVREALLAGRSAMIEAGPRDGSFFREGWSAKVRSGNVTSRVARGERSIVDLPLPSSEDYQVTVRLDPFPPPSDDTSPQAVRIFLNGVLLREVVLAWNPERVGSYDVVLTRALVTPGLNHLMFAADSSSPRSEDVRQSAGGFRLWYLLVRPGAPQDR